MSIKLLLILFTAIGLAPAVLWALASIIAVAISVAYRPFSLSFNLYFNAERSSTLHFQALPWVASVSILGGAGLLVLGLFLAFRPE